MSHFWKYADNRPINEIMQELEAKGATVKESRTFYAVRTTYDNPNFKKNSVSVYSKSNSRLVSFTEFDDMNLDRVKSNRYVHYDISANPIGIYTESYNYLPDGDIQKAISIIKLSNVIISLN
jgi:putative ubiquitin-RnfH superfamily antitoxin RatB of RatAB toxin-antitoxin module